MSSRLTNGPNPGSVLRGILLVARGSRDGLNQFGNTPHAFLTSLAPLVAFPLVGALLMLTSGEPRAAITGFLATVVALLAPAVLSYEPARWWGRQDRWLRFATALNWCQWTVPMLAVLLLAIIYPIIETAISPHAAGFVVVGLLAAYGLWLHWFIARHGLAISSLRAVLLVVFVNLVTILLVVGPQLLNSGRLDPAIL